MLTRSRRSSTPTAWRGAVAAGGRGGGGRGGGGRGGGGVLSLADVVVEHAGAVLGDLAALEVEMRGGDEGMLHDLAAVLEQSGAGGGAPVSKLGAAEMLLAAATGTALPWSIAATADAEPPTPPHEEPPEEPAPPAPKPESGNSPGLTPDEPPPHPGAP